MILADVCEDTCFYDSESNYGIFEGGFTTFSKYVIINSICLKHFNKNIYTLRRICIDGALMHQNLFNEVDIYQCFLQGLYSEHRSLAQKLQQF